MRYPLRYKGCVIIDIKIQITQINCLLQWSKRCHPGNPVRMFQWRNRLARGTYTVVHVRNAEVVSSSLTWNNAFGLVLYTSLVFDFRK